MTSGGRVIGLPLPRRGRDGDRGARARHAAGHRRRGPGVRGDDEPAGRHRRRRGHGLARGGGAARHGVHAVPPHRARRRGGAAVPGLGGGARRRRLPAQRGGGAVHRGAGRPRPGGARHRPRGQGGARPGDPRPAPPRPRAGAHAVPAHPGHLRALRDRHHDRPRPGDARRPLRHGRGRHRPPRAMHPARACTPRARSRPPACTARTGWPATRSSKGWCSGPAPRRPWPPTAIPSPPERTRRRPRDAVPAGSVASPRAELRRRNWEALGLERDGAAHAGRTSPSWTTLRGRMPAAARPRDRRGPQPRSTCRWAMAASALFREESRGGALPHRFPASPTTRRFRGHTLLEGGRLRLAPIEVAGGRRRVSRPARRRPDQDVVQLFPFARVLVVLRRLLGPRGRAARPRPRRLPPPRPHRLHQGGGAVERGLGDPGPRLQLRPLPLPAARAAQRPAAAWPSPASTPRQTAWDGRAAVPGRLRGRVLALRRQHLRVRRGAQLLHDPERVPAPGAVLRDPGRAGLPRHLHRHRRRPHAVPVGGHRSSACS